MQQCRIWAEAPPARIHSLFRYVICPKGSVTIYSEFFMGQIKWCFQCQAEGINTYTFVRYHLAIWENKGTLSEYVKFDDEWLYPNSIILVSIKFGVGLAHK